MALLYSNLLWKPRHEGWPRYVEESGDTSWVERSGVFIALRDRVWQLSGMPRRPRPAMGGLAYHVLNRAAGHAVREGGGLRGL